jgi:hypothetical protein
LYLLLSGYTGLSLLYGNVNCLCLCFVVPVRKICFMGSQQRDSDSESDTFVQRHFRTSTEVLVETMTLQYCVGSVSYLMQHCVLAVGYSRIPAEY